MNTDLLLALAAFAFVSSATPGPNNLMLMASGANFGFRRTVPHMLGVGLGFAAMIFLVGIGAMRVFALWPAAEAVLRAGSGAFVLWLAWRIACAAPPTADGPASGRPLGFPAAAAFQWVNPKAWAMALTAVTAYAPAPGPAGMLTVAAVFAAVNLPTVSAWAAAGGALRAWLAASARRARVFNATMAGLLLAVTLPMLA